MTRTVADPILLELLRSRLQAVVDEGALAIEQTAVSPIVAEGKDFASNILGPRGELLACGGKTEYKWSGGRNVVAATLDRHGATIVPGDVFAANDPHNGGGNHPQDIEICRPVFVADDLVAWVAASAHLIDVGGMTFGSWAPDATECYQEAVRFPPVRLFAGGVEQIDTWALILNNVRLPSLVEMDIRGLVASCHVSAAKLVSVIASLGVAEFAATAGAMCDNAERVLRERIGRIANGHYSMDGWVEWGLEQYHLPCRLIVDGDQLQFDFTGAPGQVPHFINSKAFIVKGEIVADIHSNLALDLPFTEAMYGPIHVVCPPGTIVDSTPPAPIASAHLDVAMNAAALAVQCLQLALAATDDDTLPRLYAAPSGQAALANHSWSYTAEDGSIDGWVLSESFQPGSPGGLRHDGTDLFANLVGSRHVLDFVDVEITEAWYPMQVLEKRAAPGPHGAGRYRSGSGCRMSYRVTGGHRLTGAMFGMRETLPIGGGAGGYPGAPTQFRIRHGDGTTEVLAGHEMGVVLGGDDVFEFEAGCGGGWGDPVDRDPAAVHRDVVVGRLSQADAAETYGVLLGPDGRVDVDATERRRAEIRMTRLRAALPAAKSVAGSRSDVASGEPSDGSTLPLYHGVVQRGSLAVSEATGAVLAVAPDHWTDGCPVVEEARLSPTGTGWIQRSYLDPGSGRVLYVEAVPRGAGRSFTTAPFHWTRHQQP